MLQSNKWPTNFQNYFEFYNVHKFYAYKKNFGWLCDKMKIKHTNH